MLKSEARAGTKRSAGMGKDLVGAPSTARSVDSSIRTKSFNRYVAVKLSMEYSWGHSAHLVGVPLRYGKVF